MFDEISWPKLIFELVLVLGMIAACVIMIIGVFRGGSDVVEFIANGRENVEFDHLKNAFVWAFSGGLSARIGLGVLQAIEKKD